MLLWDRCLVLLTCGIIVCKRLPKRCGHVGAVAVWESNHVWCSICVQRCSGLCPTRLFVILSALCTFACKLLNISVLKRVDKPALCVHYCLHAARIMIVVCTVCTMLVVRCFCLFVQMLLMVVPHGTHGIGGAYFLSEWQVFRFPYAGCTLCRYSKARLASSKSADTCVDKKRGCLHAW